MGMTSIWHWLIVLAVVLLLFGGRNKIPSLMGDIAKGIRSFKSNMKDEDAEKETADTQKLEESDAPTSDRHDAQRRNGQELNPQFRRRPLGGW